MSIKDWLRGNRDTQQKANEQPTAPPDERATMPPDDPTTQETSGLPPADPPSSDLPPDPPPPDSPPPGGPVGAPLSLADITRGMQHAASAANQLIAHQYMQALDPFFEHSDDGRLVPKVVEMALDDQHHFTLPLVALSTPRGLMLEKMKVFLTVRTDAVEQHSAISGTPDDTVGRFFVSMSPLSHEGSGRDSGHVDIEMQFTVLEPPESVMRLIEEYTRQVLPQSSVRSDDNG
ncbi:Protein of unknown function [Kosakonia arachidis]|uniref:DUF2589 domain-containing protein n=1 Tax=Kosakonia arachidis TaxID=551989 RepID=A0A1I7C697_9ENTR|nr:DUF2589 domain-containing protein [Kosakonia arachidis]SFT94939.1 Protein of unknown function [Kosakonia arachidis]